MELKAGEATGETRIRARQTSVSSTACPWHKGLLHQPAAQTTERFEMIKGRDMVDMTGCRDGDDTGAELSLRPRALSTVVGREKPDVPTVINSVAMGK